MMPLACEKRGLSFNFPDQCPRLIHGQKRVLPFHDMWRAVTEDRIDRRTDSTGF